MGASWVQTPIPWTCPNFDPRQKYFPRTLLMGCWRAQTPIVRTCPNLDPRQKYFPRTPLMGACRVQKPIVRTCPNFDPRPAKIIFLPLHWWAVGAANRQCPGHVQILTPNRKKKIFFFFHRTSLLGCWRGKLPLLRTLSRKDGTD